MEKNDCRAETAQKVSHLRYLVCILKFCVSQLPTLLLSFYFSPKIVGFYALVKTVTVYQKASEANYCAGNLSKVVEEVFRLLVSLSIFPILLLSLIRLTPFCCCLGGPML